MGLPAFILEGLGTYREVKPNKALEPAAATPGSAWWAEVIEHEHYALLLKTFRWLPKHW